MRKIRKKWLVTAVSVLAVIAVIAAACGQALDSSTTSPENTEGGEGNIFVPPNPTTQDDTSISVDNPGSGIAVGEPQPDVPSTDHKGPSDYFEVLRLAQEDLGRRLDIDTNSIELGHIEAVEWPNTALGNPQPGMVYAEVIVPGFIMLLEADNLLYRYHTSLDRVVFVEDSSTGPMVPRSGDPRPLPREEPPATSGGTKPEPQPPITIIDDMDPDECNLVHNINACFTDGQPPTNTPEE